MRELLTIAGTCESLMAAGRRGLLVTIAGTRGSTYRRAGARAVIAEDGEAFGAISGGCLERDLAARAAAWLADMRPRVHTYDASEDVVFGLGLGCRGVLEMLVEPFDAAHPPRIVRDGVQPGVLATVISSTDPRYAAGDAFPLDHAERTTRVDIDGCDVLVEVIRRERTLVIFGGGPDVAPVAQLAATAGWRVSVIAPRDVHPEEAGRTLDLAAYDAAIVMTHNYLYDLALLGALLPVEMAYIGLLGPKSRGEELLAEVGNVTPEQRARVRSPIGLDLGADSPEEIALSIVAELQAAWAGRTARPLRELDGPIHETCATDAPVCRPS